MIVCDEDSQLLQSPMRRSAFFEVAGGFTSDREIVALIAKLSYTRKTVHVGVMARCKRPVPTEASKWCADCYLAGERTVSVSKDGMQGLVRVEANAKPK